MRVLVHPMLSNYSNVGGDTNWRVNRLLVEAMLRQQEDLQFYVLTPRGWKGELGYADDPRITFVPIHYDTNRRLSARQFDVRELALFHCGEHHDVDLVFCNVPELSSAHSAFFAHGRTQHYIPAVCHPFIGTLSKYPEDRLLRIANMMSNHTVFHSRWHRENTVAFALEHMGAKAADTLERRSTVIHTIALDTEYLGQHGASTEYERPTIAWPHKLDEQKGYKETFAELERLWATGFDFRLCVMNPGKNATCRALELPFAFEGGSRPHSAYLDTLSRCHLVLAWPREDTWNNAVMEAAFYGLPVLAPNAMCFPEQMPDGYPYLFDTPDEMRGMLKHLLERPEERQKWGSIVARHVRERHDVNVIAGQLLAHWEEVLALPGYGWRVGDEKRQRILDAAESAGRSPISMAQLNTAHRKLHGYPVSNSLFGIGSEARRVLLAAGWKDDYTSARPLYHRPDGAEQPTADLAVEGARGDD